MTLTQAWKDCQKDIKQIIKLQEETAGSYKEAFSPAIKIMELGNKLFKTTERHNIMVLPPEKGSAYLITINKHGLGIEYKYLFGKKPTKELLQSLMTEKNSHSYPITESRELQKIINAAGFIEAFQKACPNINQNDFLAFTKIVKEMKLPAISYDEDTTKFIEDKKNFTNGNVTIDGRGTILAKGKYGSLDTEKINDYIHIEEHAQQIKDMLTQQTKNNKEMIQHNQDLYKELKEIFKVFVFINEVI